MLIEKWKIICYSDCVIRLIVEIKQFPLCATSILLLLWIVLRVMNKLKKCKSSSKVPRPKLVYRAGEAAFTSFCGQRHTRCGQHYVKPPLLSPTKVRYPLGAGSTQDNPQTPGKNLNQDSNPGTFSAKLSRAAKRPPCPTKSNVKQH